MPQSLGTVRSGWDRGGIDAIGKMNSEDSCCRRGLIERTRVAVIIVQAMTRRDWTRGRRPSRAGKDISCVCSCNRRKKGQGQSRAWTLTVGLPRWEEVHNSLDLQRVPEGCECETLRPHLPRLPCVWTVAVRGYVEEIECSDQSAQGVERGGGVCRYETSAAYLTISPGRFCHERAILPLYALFMTVCAASSPSRTTAGEPCVGEGIAQGVTGMGEVTDRDWAVSHPQSPLAPAV